MTGKLHSLPSWVYQLLLMGLLGSSGIVFLPVLVRVIDSAIMAKIMVAQVYVYYLSQLTQFGFVWSGPAALARSHSEPDSIHIWRTSIYSKLMLLTGPVAIVFALGYWLQGCHQSYLICFAVLLIAYALHSNWFLQAKADFVTGAELVLLGMLISVILLWVLLRTELIQPELQAFVVILILILPQAALGIGSYFSVKAMCLRQDLTPIQFSDISTPIIKDSPLVLGQLLVLAATTLGTPVVASLANADITTAYAATEKLFNLGATVLVGLYMAYYPRLAKSYHSDVREYWRQILRLSKYLLASGAIGLLALYWTGEYLLGMYLTTALAAPVHPILLAFGCWLILCLSQHVLTGYLIFAQRPLSVLLLNLLVLAITGLTGYAWALQNPLHWVYGMIAGQSIPLLLLAYRYWLDHQYA